MQLLEEFLLAQLCQVGEHRDGDDGIEVAARIRQWWCRPTDDPDDMVEVVVDPFHVPFVNIASVNFMRMSLEHSGQATTAAPEVEHLLVFCKRSIGSVSERCKQVRPVAREVSLARKPGHVMHESSRGERADVTP